MGSGTWGCCNLGNWSWPNPIGFQPFSGRWFGLGASQSSGKVAPGKDGLEIESNMLIMLRCADNDWCVVQSLDI